jgi:hypothetical protein
MHATTLTTAAKVPSDITRRRLGAPVLLPRLAISSGVFILVLCNPGNSWLARLSGDCSSAFNRLRPFRFRLNAE